MTKVAIFGGSPYGRFVRMMLDEKKYEVVVYFDNGELALKRGILDGVVIDRPENAEHYNFDYIIIAIAQYSEAIKSQLLNLGIPSRKIVTFMENYGNKVVFHHDTRLAQLKLCMEEIVHRRLNGNMAELGVYKGDFARHMNAVFPEKKLYLFDTFEGFNDKDQDSRDERTGYEELFTDTNLDVVMAKMINPANCIPRKGWFPQTLEGMPEEEYCLVSLDTDIYQPMFSGLDYFYPRLVQGGYIFVHDFGNNDWNGIRKAVEDFCCKHNAGYVPILDRCGSVIITK